MNKHCHRLVFNRQRGMRVPTAEHVRNSGKSGSGETASQPVTARSSSSAPHAATAWAGAFGAIGLSVLLPALPSLAVAAAPIPSAATLAPRAALPVRSTDPTRKAGDFGNFSISTPNANQMRVDQSSPRAIINWDSFNVGAGNRVQFVQPDKGSTLNKIWSADPSVISGRIQANGEVILQNANGVIFSPTARVETGRFVATALQVAESLYKTGLRGATEPDTPAFSAPADQTKGFVSLERGAEVRTAAGGDVLIFAPRVVNAGRIETPDGQTVLGAGQTVYLAASGDQSQRGLLIGVRPFSTADADLNTVTQAAAQTYKTVAGETVANDTAAGTAGLVERINAIVAERGTINLVALAIRQNGLLQATTAVKGLNGVIQLQAQAEVNPFARQQVAGVDVAVPQTTGLGRVTLGATSLTQVLPSVNINDTQLDAETFNRSRVRVEGERIDVQGGAVVRAPSGSIEMLASQLPSRSVVFEPNSFDLADHSADPSRIVVGAGAVLDVAGLKNVALPATRNQMSTRLFQIELADSPVQRNGVLYREEVFFDARKPPTIANVQGVFGTVSRTAQELSTTGGRINLQADGAVAVDWKAVLDISGGSLAYGAGQIKTSLVRRGDRWIGIDQATRSTQYDELGNSKLRTETNAAVFRVEEAQAYVEGKDAGKATIAGRLTYFDGQVLGRTTVGPTQSGRSLGAAPLGGTLEFGRLRVTDSALASLVLQSSPTASRPGVLFDDPLESPIDGLVQPTVALSTEQLRGSGLASLRAMVAGSFAMTAGTQLDLKPGGQFMVQAETAEIDGQVHVPSGRIEINTPANGSNKNAITLGAAARLDASGQWTEVGSNQSAGSANSNSPVAVNGGSIQLSTAGSLAAEPGSTLDVSAGARRAGTALTRGAAGSIGLTINEGTNGTQVPSSLNNWFAVLQGFDFARGGALSVSGLPEITLGVQGGAVGNRLSDTQLFSDSGFGSLAFNTLGNITLGPDLNLTLQLKNFLPFESPGRAAEQGRFAAVGTLPLASQRSAVSLALTSSAGSASGSSVDMQAGATIATEAGGSLRFTARQNLQVNGSLLAPGGNIALTLAGSRGGNVISGVFEDQIGFDPAQALWIGEHARLSVAGTTELSKNRLGQVIGDVLGGGSITLAAQRGYVVAKAGADLDLRGASAKVQSSSSSAPETVSRAGGTLAISSPEGVYLAATVHAQPADQLADGGSFSLAMTLGGRERFTSGPAYSKSDREIRLIEATPLANLGLTTPGENLIPTLGNGTAVLSNPMLRNAGFSQITLKADDRITFGDNLNLVAQRSLTLDSPALTGASGTETALKTQVLALGDQRRTPRTAAENTSLARSGDATLDAQAALVDLFGDLALDGFKFTSMNATSDPSGGTTRRDGEVRLIGTTRGTENVASGNLRFAGELQFTAGQSYASTMSDYRIEGLPGDSYFSTHMPALGSASSTPYSALASLNIKADWVDLGGVSRQPFGSLQVEANRLRVLDGATLSVSGEGATVPVGTTVNGTRWQYRPTGLYNDAGQTLSVNASDTADIRVLNQLPQGKELRLKAQSLTVADTALLSASGGGSLQAWEFVAGVGGSRDALSESGIFAVIPNHNSGFAPYDGEVMSRGAAASLRAGSQISITMPGSALAPGQYTLLPARYALLPGAVLVSLAKNQGSAPLDVALNNDDGSAVVTGRFSALGASLTGTPVSRILVQPAATVLAQSRLDVTQIDALLATAAERTDVASPAGPAAAGLVALGAAQPFNFAARLNLAGTLGKPGGAFEGTVAGGKIAIVDEVSKAPAGLGPDWSLWSAQRLSQSAAGSVLVGGEKDKLSGGIKATASTVRLLATESALSGEEALLVARDELNLGTGSQLRAPKASMQDLGRHEIKLMGDAAYALVSAANNVDVTRVYSSGATGGNSGRLQLDPGAQVGGNSVELGASTALALDPSAQIDTTHLGLAAQRIRWGQGANADDGATVLQGPLLAQLGDLSALKLSAIKGIDFAISSTLTLDRLLLDAPALNGLAGDVHTRFSAYDVSLVNRSGASNSTVSPGSGSLTISSRADAQGKLGSFLIGSHAEEQQPQVLAYGSTRMEADGDMVFAGTGQLRALGDTTLSAQRITALGGAKHGVLAQGLLQVKRQGNLPTLSSTVGSGADLSFEAKRIEQDGTVEAAGGTLSFNATGTAGTALAGLRLGATSRTAAAGYAVQANPNWAVYGNAGRIFVSSAADVELAGQLDVSAPGDAGAGQVRITADKGKLTLEGTAQLLGAGGNRAAQGTFEADTRTLQGPSPESSGLDAWAQALNTGGFHKAVNLRQRSGDLNLNRSTLRAEVINLATDSGSVLVGGVVDAQSDAGGSVSIFASQDTTLTGRIDARSTRAGANGGSVTLGAAAGTLRLGTEASIDAGGDDADDGRIVLRTSRDDAAGTVGLTLDTNFDSQRQLKAADIAIEAVRTYTGYSTLVRNLGSGAQLSQATLRSDNQQFADNASGALASMGLSGDNRVALRSGVQIIGTGDFTVRDDWNLFEVDRPGGQPGLLTLRAAGNLLINGNISDGFANAARPNGNNLRQPTAMAEGPAWSLRLVAGADTGAAHPLATLEGAAADLKLADDKWIRTTSGSIDLAAAQDIKLGTGAAGAQQGVVYVAGRPSTTLTDLALSDSAWTPQFTAQGGHLALSAGRDVVGAPATQLFNAWLYQTGTEDSTAVSWFSAFDAYRQGVASFGGGNLRVSAGRDVTNLGAAAPTSGLAPGLLESLPQDPSAQPPVPAVENGGNVSVQAGRNILGGTYLLGRGQGSLNAGGSIAASPGFNATRVPGTGPVAGLMDGQWTVAAGGAIEIASVFNPTMLPSANRGNPARIGESDAALFFTYRPESAVTVRSQQGTVSLMADRLGAGTAGTLGMSSHWSNLANNGPTAERINWGPSFASATSWLPPNVDIKAMGGDVRITMPGYSAGLTLFPAATGSLTMYARDDISLQANTNTLVLAMSDRQASSLPSVTKPILPSQVDLPNFNQLNTALPGSFSSLHVGDNQPVRLHAGGNIDMDQGDRSSRVLLLMPKAAEITAGGDILKLSYLGQHTGATDLTRIQAEGSVLQGNQTTQRITLTGPGRLELLAGRQLDLGASQGVETVGSKYNPALPEAGADLLLAAGMRAKLDLPTFILRYLTPADDPQAGSRAAQALADAYLAATGRDPTALDTAAQAQRAQLTQRFSDQIALWGGGDATALQARRDSLVDAVRRATGQTIPGSAAERSAAYESSLAKFNAMPAALQTAVAEQLLRQQFAQSYLVSGKSYSQLWQRSAELAGVSPEVFSGPVFEQVQREVLFAELNVAGAGAAALPSSATAVRKATYDFGFLAADLAGLGSSKRFAGDLDMVASGAQTLAGGTITMLAPGGQINVGLPGTSGSSPNGIKGVVSYGAGGVSAYSKGDFQVNSQRVFVVGQGDITVWSSQANIDAGRGANTTVSVPPLVAVRQSDGSVLFSLPSLTVGSGIGILQPAVGQAQGDIGLYAPNGEVRALDAQIRAPGRITLAANVVRGADNISGGSVVGAPVVVPPVPFSLPTAAPSAGEAQAAGAAASGAAGSQQARERQSLLMVELLGLGLPADEENCNVGSTEEKAECDRRKKARAEPNGPRTTPTTRN